MSETKIETRIIEVDPRELKLLEDNARFMRHEEFQRLVANIKRDGVLTSVPFAWLDRESGKYEVLSGNHRVMAAIEAGIETISCIVTDEELSKDQRVAIQLSHNSIVGQDDPATLKRLYDSILNVDLKEYSGLDDKTLELLDKANAQAMNEANLEFQTLSIVFLPNELKEAQRVIGLAKDGAKASKAVWLAKDEDYDKWLDAQETVSAAYNIVNVSAAIKVICRIFEHNLGQLSEGWFEVEKNDNMQWVPFSTIIGRTKIPAGCAKTIKTAIERMIGRGEISEKTPWEGLAKVCRDYLEG